jgi:alkylation response protein AidB-like acyl-CoA dehydrogenase
MDFHYSEDQIAIRDLAKQILEDRVPAAGILKLVQADGWYDGGTWQALAQASLLGVALPESCGGAGMGFAELGLILEEAGRRVAPLPLIPTLVMGAMPIAEFGNDVQKQMNLPGVAKGERFLTAALVEEGRRDPTCPRTRARTEADGFVLSGVKTCVPAAKIAARILVPAATDDDGVAVFLVDPGASGVTLEDQQMTSGEPHSLLTLDNVSVAAGDRLGGPKDGAAILRWTLDRTMVAACAVQLGIADSALEQTAAYQSERKQFGVAIGTFQGPQIRAADAWIDTEAMRATLQQALWCVATERYAAREIEVAKWWACRGGHRVAHACQHLHGGIGADVEYPIHRWFLAAKQNEMILGGASLHQARLGELLASGEEA